MDVDNLSKEESDSITSDTDDDLEDTPEFIKKSNQGSQIVSSSHSNEALDQKDSPEKANKLDILLSEHRKQEEKSERLNKLKAELLEGICNGSQEEEDMEAENLQSLGTQYDNQIEQFEVKTSKLKSTHPGLHLFHQERFCCLFTESVTLFSWGFTPSNSSIDRVLASVKPENVSNLLLSKALLPCIHQISCLDSVMIWLLSLLSIHSSPVIVQMCYINLTGMIQQYKVNKMAVDGRGCKSWCPSRMELLLILVNLGADSQELIGSHCMYTSEDLSKYLAKENNENVEHKENSLGKVHCENMGRFLDVLSASFQTRPRVNTEDLNLMFYMLAKTALDVSLQIGVMREIQVCFSSLLECYDKTEWPALVPKLCKQLSQVTDHHHNQLHLVDLLLPGLKGSYLRTRLSYLFLHQLLVGSEEVADSDLENIKLIDLVHLGHPNEEGRDGSLCDSLQDLMKRDVYQMSSAIRLLDYCAGDELQRSSETTCHIELLISQVKLVIKTIKDRVSEQDLTWIKDTLSKLTVKWSLTSKNTRASQRSMYHWATATTHQKVEPEVLQGRNLPEDDDIEDD